MSVKVHVGSTVEACDDWPTRQQLQRLFEEDTLDELYALSSSGVAGLCKRLGSDPQEGLPGNVPDISRRVERFGGNWFAERRLTPYWRFLWEALQDKIILLLLFIGTLELLVKEIFVPAERSEGWIEPVAIYVTVLIIINVQGGLDYKRERLFFSLSKKLAASNTRFVIRSGKQVSLTDDQIVVGDVVAFNAHLAAMIPADGVLISGDGVKMDESALTGETEPIAKGADHPFIISGTTVNAGAGRMLIVAVGEYSVSGKIRKAVYDEDAEPSPLFTKLDRMANNIGRVGTLVALMCFIASCIEGFGVRHDSAEHIIEYILLALGVLAAAVPEGLPLALTISLALSSNKMSGQNNLVKTLDSCETMGSVTTICTDKTGTLTANRMTVQAAQVGGVTFQADGYSAIGPRVKADTRLSLPVRELTAALISVCTMDESQVLPPEAGSSEPRFVGNPTECAMLRFVEECGYSYRTIRESTVGRNELTRSKGSAKGFTSARKLMSWAVPLRGTGLPRYRVYAKGASEIIMGRVVSVLDPDGHAHDITEANQEAIVEEVITPFADMAFRTIALAYRDMDEEPDDSLHDDILNSDGSQAYECETGLTLVGILGIADPLRPEVPLAIQQCYGAGIDVRMVTGDNLATAVAIAKAAGILNDKLHFDANGKMKPFRAMEGKAFRSYVHKLTDGEAVFSQERFDEVWPYLRVLARSSPEDKLTLAKGLNGSLLFQNREQVKAFKQTDNIVIFPDRQVVAMTGDGTNDAPALKAADVGFAMGISGTQIAKDAANIILLDDNFASIVTAAKWGRNVFDSIQKFLQFQLTVNISLLAVVLIAALSGIEPPLKLLHLLWLNMIMDSLASIALASEPPTERQLQRPPVNRSDNIITRRMLWNMVGQSVYQVTTFCVLMFHPSLLPGCKDGTGALSEHYTILFNVFVLFQLFNEYNSRCLLGELNIFRGLVNNPMFLIISAITFVAQVLMTQFGSKVLQLNETGLTGAQWLLCLILGAASWVWQPVINMVKWLTDIIVAHLRGCCCSSSSRDQEEESPSRAAWHP